MKNRISSQKDYDYFLKMDSIALGIDSSFRMRLKRFLMPNVIWDFQKLLRKTEFVENTRSKSVFGKMQLYFLKRRLRKGSIKLGFSIPTNVFGPGLAIVHYGTIVINSTAKVGANCRIHACTNIGASGGNAQAPIIGDNVYLGPGVKVYGEITIANNCALAANAAVATSFLNENKLIGGVPAKEISDIDIHKLIKHINN